MLHRRTGLALEAVRYAMLSLMAALSVSPLLWLFLTSIKTEVDIFTLPPPLVFKPTLKAYAYVIRMGFLKDYFVNSIKVAVGTVAVSLVAGGMAAYALASYRLRGAKVISVAVLTARMLPGVVVAIPLYLLMRSVGLANTILGLIIAHTALNLPFAVWMLRSYLASIPREIEQAALIDGCSVIQAIRWIVVPVAMPGIVATAIFMFLTSWNEFLFALTLAYSPASQTMPVAVTGFISARGIAWSELSAAASLMLTPGLLFGILARKYIVSGLSHGAIR